MLLRCRLPPPSCRCFGKFYFSCQRDLFISIFCGCRYWAFTLCRCCWLKKIFSLVIMMLTKWNQISSHCVSVFFQFRDIVALDLSYCCCEFTYMNFIFSGTRYRLIVRKFVKQFSRAFLLLLAFFLSFVCCYFFPHWVCFLSLRIKSTLISLKWLVCVFLPLFTLIPTYREQKEISSQVEMMRFRFVTFAKLKITLNILFFALATENLIRVMKNILLFAGEKKEEAEVKELKSQ